MTIRKVDNSVADIISAAQDLTGAWVDLGEVIDVRDVKLIALWLKLDINDSTDVRIRALAKTSETSDDYVFPIKSASSSAVSLQDEYYEFTDDTDQNMLLDFEVGDIVPFIKFQVMAGTVGASAGNIADAVVSFEKIAF